MADTTPAIKQPVNDENPVYLPLFVFRLRLWMYTTYPASRRFVEYGIKTERGKTLCWDVTHALRHKNLKPDQEAPSSWDSPFTPYPDEFLSEELLKRYVKEVEATAAKAEKAGDEDLEFPELEAAAELLRVAGARGPPSSPPPDYSDITLSDRDEKRFNPNASDSLSEFDEYLFVAASSCWSSHSVRDALRTDCRASFLRLIARLHDDVRKLGPEASDKLAELFGIQLKSLLAAPSTSAFQDAIALTDAYNAVVIETERKSEAAILAYHVKLVRKLGDAPALRVELKMNEALLTLRTKTGQADAQLDRRQLHVCLLGVLGEIEASATNIASASRALSLRDPDRPGAVGDDLPPPGGKKPPPFACREKGCAKMHWENECPIRIERLKKEAEKKKKEEKKALKAAKAEAKKAEPADKSNTNLVRNKAANEAGDEDSGSDDAPPSAGEIALASLFTGSGGFARALPGRSLVARRGQAATANDLAAAESRPSFPPPPEPPVPQAQLAHTLRCPDKAELLNIWNAEQQSIATAQTNLASLGANSSSPARSVGASTDACGNTSSDESENFPEDLDVAAGNLEVLGLRKELDTLQTSYFAMVNQNDYDDPRLYLVTTVARPNEDDPKWMLSFGVGPGIYYGTWDEPDFISRLVKGRRIVVPNCNAPSKNYKKNLNAAVRAARQLQMHPILCGPRPFTDPDDGTVYAVGTYFGDDVIDAAPHLPAPPPPQQQPPPAPFLMGTAVQQLSSDGGATIDPEKVANLATLLRVRDDLSNDLAPSSSLQPAIISLLASSTIDAAECSQMLCRFEVKASIAETDRARKAAEQEALAHAIREEAARANEAERKLAEAAKAAERARSEAALASSRRAFVAKVASGLLSLSVLAVAMILFGSSSYDPGALQPPASNLALPSGHPANASTQLVAALLSCLLAAAQGKLLYRAWRVPHRPTRTPRPWWWRYTTITASHASSTIRTLSADAPKNHFGRAASKAFSLADSQCSIYWLLFGLVHGLLATGASLLRIPDLKRVDFTDGLHMQLTPTAKKSIRIPALLLFCWTSSMWHQHVYGTCKPPPFRLRNIKVCAIIATALVIAIRSTTRLRRRFGCCTFWCLESTAALAANVLFLFAHRKNLRDRPAVVPPTAPTPAEKVSLHVDLSSPSRPVAALPTEPAEALRPTPPPAAKKHARDKPTPRSRGCCAPPLACAATRSVPSRHRRGDGYHACCSANVGRVLLNRRERAARVQRDRRRPRSRRGLPAYVKSLVLTIDSGCAWHVHHCLDDLINVRPCEDTFSGVDRIVHGCAGIGDLPFACVDSRGVAHRFILRNVRCVTSFKETLLSVDQLWEDSKINVVFQGLNKLVLPPDGQGQVLELKLQRSDGLFELPVAGTAGEKNAPKRARTLKASAGIRSAHAHSHIDRLAPDDAAAVLHRRLHIGVDRLRSLPDFSRDAPDCLRRCRNAPCPSCTEANAKHLSHSADQYVPSYPGRLIHADLAGPFVSSRIGGFRYMLVLTDDHSRFKFVQFLRSKDQAPAAVASFAASLESLLSRGRHKPARVITTFHSDNAGEFFSQAFSEFLDSKGIAHTACPPHVHQLNGVAERSIRSIMEAVRASIVASGSPIGFWNYAAQHACDVLNRTTGPPTGGMSSYEALLGEKPCVMGIMPFGCRAFAVKPSAAVNKTSIEPHAWVGQNLGRSPDTPGAFHVWLGHLQKVVSTSEVYFDETLMPWLPTEHQRVDAPVALPATADDSPPLPSPVPGPMPPAADAPQSQAQALLDTQRMRGSAACSSRTILVLFSGPFARPDGLNVFLTRLGLDVQMVDCSSEYGGGTEHNLLRDSVFQRLLRNAHNGVYRAIIAAPPCSTFSVARFFTPKDGRQGPPPVRDREHIGGLPDVSAKHQRELQDANELVTRTIAVALAAFDSGGEFLIENPADRGDENSSIYMEGRHGPLWTMPSILQLARVTTSELITFPQCALGADYQKYTTFMCSPALAAQLRSLNKLRCDHETHTQAGGSRKGDEWESAKSSAYPSDLNLLLAQCCATIATNRHPNVPAEVDDANQAAQPATRAPTTASQLPEHVSHEDAAADLAVSSSAAPRPPPEAPSAPPLPAPPVDLAADEDPAPEPAYSCEVAGSHSVSRAADKSPKKKGPWQRSGEPIRSSLRPRPNRLLAVRHNNTFNIPPSFWKGDHKCMLAGKAPSTGDPHNRKAMLKDRDVLGWKEAELTELQNHRDNSSWTELDRSELPSGRKLVRMTWVYKRKRSGKLKARLCVQGCSQIPGVDYGQTFCATMRGTTLRLLSAVAAQGDFHLRRWDFVAAYLQGSLEPGEVVYCFGPPGHETLGPDGKPRILRIEKPVYGMAQSGRRWQRSIFPWLTSPEVGLTQLDSDNCVFRRRARVSLPGGKSRVETLIVGLYVDDLFIVHSHNDKHSLYQQFVKKLTSDWEAEDEGEVSDLLNVEFSRSRHGVKLSQGSYVDTLLQRFAPEGIPDSFHANHAPAECDLRERVEEAISDERESTPSAEEIKDFQSIVGALLYASMNTRPDIALAVGLLCRAMSKPTPALQQAAVRVVWYLGRHRDVGLTYAPDDRAMHGQSDSDWAVRHSTGGFVFNYCRAAVTWSSKKQPTIALSSCEAELMALSEAAKEALYLRDFLDELELSDGRPMSLGCDNQAAGDLAYNPEHHQRTKHIARRHFFVREAVEDLRLVVPFVSTVDNMADFFTKPLKPADFFRMRDAIMNVPPRPSLDEA